jgi:hypothetical protein
MITIFRQSKNILKVIEINLIKGLYAKNLDIKVITGHLG